MGQNFQKAHLPYEFQDFIPEEWVLTDSKESNSYLGRCVTLTNKKTNIRIDKYQLTFDSDHQFKKCIELFEWRKNKPSINKSLYFVPLSRKKICSTDKNKAIMYIDHASWRLSQIKDIPFPDNLYLLKSLCRGYGQLYKFFGNFQITEQQVSINNDGHISVWFNSNLSHFKKQLGQSHQSLKSTFRNSFNHIQTSRDSVLYEEQEEMMVEKIVAMVCYNTDSESQPLPSLRQFYCSFKLSSQLTFRKLTEMLEEYIEIIRINFRSQGIDSEFLMPEKLQSIQFLNQLKQSQKSPQKLENSKTQRTIKPNKVVKNIEIMNEINIRRPTTYNCYSLPNRNPKFRNIERLQKKGSTENFNAIINKNKQLRLLQTPSNITDAIPQKCRYKTHETLETSMRNTFQPDKHKSTQISDKLNKFKKIKFTHHPCESCVDQTKGRIQPFIFPTYNRNKWKQSNLSFNNTQHMKDRNPVDFFNNNTQHIIRDNSPMNFFPSPIKLNKWVHKTEISPKHKYFISKAKQAPTNLYYFSTDGRQHFLDKEIEEDLNLYNI